MGPSVSTLNISDPGEVGGGIVWRVPLVVAIRPLDLAGVCQCLDVALPLRLLATQSAVGTATSNRPVRMSLASAAPLKRPILDRLGPLGELRVPRFASHGFSSHVRPPSPLPKQLLLASIHPSAACVCLFLCFTFLRGLRTCSLPSTRCLTPLISSEDGLIPKEPQ